MSLPGRLFAAYREAYRGLPRATWVLAAVFFVNRCGTMVLPFLALYLTTQRGLAESQVGLLLTFYGVGSGVGSYLGGELTDRLGPRRVQAGALICLGVGLLALGQLRHAGTIGAGLFLIASTGEMFRPASAVAVAASAPRERWTQAFSLRRLALNLGMTFGPMVGGFLAARDYRLLFVVDGSTALLAAGVLLLFDRSNDAAPAPAAVDAGKATRAGGSPWRDGPFLALFGILFVYGSVLYQFFSTYPLTLHEVHRLPEPKIGSIYAINTVLIVVCEMLLVRRLAALPPLRVAGLGNLLFCGGLGLLPFVHGYSLIAASVVVWTCGEMLTMPFLETVAAGRGDERSRGRYLGAYNFAFSLAFAVAPVLGVTLYARFGARPLFAGMMVVGVLLCLALQALAPRLPGDHAASAPPGAAAEAVPAAPAGPAVPSP